MERPASNRGLWIAQVLGVVGIAFGASGYAMVASLSVGHPEQAAHWHRMAYVYLALVGLSFVSLVGAIVALWRRHARGPAERRVRAV